MQYSPKGELPHLVRKEILMKSPFPGMDPYLEQFWPDLHARLILYASDHLEEQLPTDLIARVEERVVLETEPDPHRVYPDVKITERPGRGVAVRAAPRKTSFIEPVIVEYRGEPATETYLNILEAGPGQRLITVIEILSLTNKLPGEGQQQDRRKQKELEQTGVSLVEIDLLRRGTRVLSVLQSHVPPRARTTYQACVRRGWQSNRFEVYPIPLRSPLPAILVPLRKTDDDVILNLQALLEQAYHKGRYHLTIDYSHPPEPPFPRDDAKWVRNVAKPRRSKKRP